MNIIRGKLAIFLIGLLLVFAVIVLEQQYSMNPPFMRALGRVHLQMKVVSLAAEDYARSHNGVFPTRVDDDFSKSISERAKGSRLDWSTNSAWLESDVASSKSEALEKAKRDLGPEKVLYCARQDGSRGAGFFVFGKDGNGSLVDGITRGTGQTPLILEPGDAEATK